MSIHRGMRVVMILSLLTLLIVALPHHPFSTSAADQSLSPDSAAVLASQPDAMSRTSDPEDEALVRESLIHPVQDEVFYFVLPDRFNNADTANDVGDDPGGTTEADALRHGFLPTDKGFYHGGDVKGLTAKLDYIQDMGVTAIWMAPIFKNRPVQGDGTIAGSSAGYHGYWITDFTQIDPHFGTNQDLKDLVAAAHARDIKVFFDIITNHTADVIKYEEGEYTYRNKEEYPFRDANGEPFDDRDFAGQDTFPELNLDSFPYTPVFEQPEDATVKVPAWLNDRTLYHNRGDTTFVGEDSFYGDFFGLDDLFTARPEVVDGMIDIYKFWISEFKIDGFRIDTVKHVNIEFWQEFSPALEAHAQAEGIDDFFMFGEVFEQSDVPFLSSFTTEGKLPGVLDFRFQDRTRAYVSQSAPSNELRDFFASDDYYTDADSNAYRLPVFIGNHDMGRFGHFLDVDNPDASNDELLARSKLGHALMYFARGMPVVYYGDEQGFIGDGNDKDARETIFATQVESYIDNEYIGTDADPESDKFDTEHPLYQAFQSYAAIYSEHEALRQGAQIHRYSSDEAGVYAFSRIDRDEQVEYVVAVNNAETEQTATFGTFTPAGVAFSAVYPAGADALTTDADGALTVTVPKLDFVIYQASEPLPASAAAPGIAITSPAMDGGIFGRAEIATELDTDVFAEVTFAVKVGDDEAYTVIGTDNNVPYRVFYDVSGLPVDTPLTFKAIVNDLNPEDNHLASATVNAVVAAEPEPPCVAVTHAIIHYQRPEGDYGTVDDNDYWGLHLWGEAITGEEVTEWDAPKPFMGETSFGRFAFIELADATQPLNFIVHTPSGDEVPDTREPGGDRSFIPAETPEIWLVQGDETIYTSQAEAQGYVTVHYQRPEGDYGSVEDDDYWGLHLWGDAIAEGVATEWDAPRPADGVNDFGAFYNIPIADAQQAVNFIMHLPGEDSVPDTREPGGDRSFVPAETPEIWLVQGDETVYTTRAAAENVAILHYHRPEGDYGDATSSNFNDYWGLHVWTGAADPTDWPEPIKPAGTDAFGVYYEVPLEAEATLLNYILHRGDEKDLPEDQSLDLTTYGNEVWILQGTPGYIRPVSDTVCDPGGVADDEALYLPIIGQ